MSDLRQQLLLAAEIRELHAEIIASARTSLDSAVKIGELLQEVKAGLAHGQWLPWIKDNVPFAVQTAQRYMRLWERREELKCVSVTYLTDAYLLLTEPRKTKILPAVPVPAEPPQGILPMASYARPPTGAEAQCGTVPAGTPTGSTAAAGTLPHWSGSIGQPSPIKESPRACEARSGTGQPATSPDDPTPGDLAGQAVALLTRIPLDHPDRRDALFYVMDWIIENKTPGTPCPTSS